jgi:hypothetical protein
MAEGLPERRGYLARPALDPNPDVPDESADGEITVYLSYARLQALGKRSKGQVMEAAHIVPDTLTNPSSMFEGLRRDEDEPRDGETGWRCYCGCPNASFREDGTRVAPWKGQVYLVFVNEDRVAYNWRWEPADEMDPNLPRNHEARFRKRLF